MQIVAAAPSNVDEAVACLASAFACDPITRFLLQDDPGYQDRVKKFFSLLMRARIALKMPVLLAVSDAGIHGAAMGYKAERLEWPNDLEQEWELFENSVPGMIDRMAVYDEIAAKGTPSVPHYYLGVIGVAPPMHGLGIGAQLLKSFCELSASDRLSRGGYLETATASNLRFYERAGFAETARGSLGRSTLWCMYLPQAPR